MSDICITCKTDEIFRNMDGNVLLFCAQNKKIIAKSIFMKKNFQFDAKQISSFLKTLSTLTPTLTI